VHPGAKLKSALVDAVALATPMIIAPPLFSRDVFSYAAQGEMTFGNISPYLYGPFTLGSTPYVTPVDPLWGNTPRPTGVLPLPRRQDRLDLTAHELWTVVGFACSRLSPWR